MNIKVKKLIKAKEPLIKGTKIPISYLIDYFKEGLTITDFLSSYPWIKKSNLIGTLEEIKKEKTTSRYAF